VNLIRRLAGFALLALSLAAPVFAQGSPAWTTPFPPFRIAGNLYYVGSKDLAAYLVATPKGLILINANLRSSPPLIEKSVAALGFHFKDVKILLVSHAHYDHCAGAAQILKLTGAKYEVMAPDVPVVESGGRDDFQYSADPSMHFPSAHVDRALHDGDTVSLSGTTLTAHLTPGHTKGTTTWTLEEPFDGRRMHIVIAGSASVNPGYRLVGNKAYPRIATDYEHGFAVLRGLPCDIFLGAHGGYFGLMEKYARWKAGNKNAFVDPAGYKAYIADSERAFEMDLHRQQGRRR
jgi:metallo-beta-lactamase class B